MPSSQLIRKYFTLQNRDNDINFEKKNRSIFLKMSVLCTQKKLLKSRLQYCSKHIDIAIMPYVNYYMKVKSFTWHLILQLPLFSSFLSHTILHKCFNVTSRRSSKSILTITTMMALVDFMN